MQFVVEEIDENTSLEDLQKMMVVALVYRVLVCFYEVSDQIISSPVHAVGKSAVLCRACFNLTEGCFYMGPLLFLKDHFL